MRFWPFTRQPGPSALDDVGFQLRHADPRTTSRVYVHMRSVDVKRSMSECLSREEALR